MDKLRRLVAGDARAGNGKPEPAPHVKAGGHGDHWGCIYRSVDESDLLSTIQQVVESDSRPVGFAAQGGGAAYHSPAGPVQVCVLVVGSSLVSSYPVANAGVPWPILVHSVVPWENGIEGQITGECHGASISFFDTQYYANRGKYKIGQEYTFRMSGFAYVADRAPDNEVEIEPGTKVSLKGARAYMPANLGSNTGADIDEFWFHSPVESPVEGVEFVGRELKVIPVTMALPDEFEMSLPLYAASHVLGASMEGIQPQDDVEGYLWLQGYLHEES